MRRWALIISMLALAAGCNNNTESKKNTSGMETGLARPVSWAHNTNIYEVNLRQYTNEGTFNAFKKELPRLREMGVETLWFMPITPISQKGKKGTLGSQYACSDYKAISGEFGTLDDFKSLVKDAHQQGFKVIIDWVANHTGWDHVWTTQHPEYYLKDSATNDFKIASGMDDIIELNYDNPALRNAMIKAMQYWVTECDIDGFRCDLAAWVQADFWAEARPQVDAVKPLFWLGEFDELENPEHGKVFDASYSWNWMHKTREFCEKNLAIETLDTLLNRYSAIGDSSMRAWFTTNHDENSWNGTEYDKYGVAALPLAVFSATWNGVPLLYSGQELPNKKKLEFFEKDVIKWNGKYELAAFYKTLLTLHSKNPALRAGDKSVSTHRLKTSADDKVFAYVRKNGDRAVLVLLNLSKESADFQLTDEAGNGTYKDVFSGSEQQVNTTSKYQLAAGGYLVFEK